MTDTLGWGIIGAGGIARAFARQLPQSATGRLVAVASRELARARAFAEEFGGDDGPVPHGSYADLLADPAVDAVYVATPHPQHAEWAIRAARAGKHVLVEKPMTVDPAHTMAVQQAARENGVVLLEAFMHRAHPQWRTLETMLRDGELGRILSVSAHFAFAGSDEPSRITLPELAGGGVLDVGCYTLSAFTLVADATGHDLSAAALERARIATAGRADENGVDRWAAMTIALEGEDVGDGAGSPGGAADGSSADSAPARLPLTAQLECGVAIALEPQVRVVGEAGILTLTDPWTPDPERPARALLQRPGAPDQELLFPPFSQYAGEADALAEAVAAGATESPLVPWSHSTAMALLERRWRHGIGAVYASERDDAPTPPVAGETLRRAGRGSMPMGRVEGVRVPLSRLVMGADNQSSLRQAAVMFDDYVERGGTVFDTAWLYGGGRQERLLGEWMRQRGVRDEVAVIVKGAHTPHCDPESVTRQLHESLDRLKTDRADLYFLHRDNESVPVGEFVDVLDEHWRAGRIGAFGGSNWSIERMDAAREYAAANGRQSFTVLSNHFGLAEALDLPWEGCRHATDPASKEWLERTQTPLFPWSSQARGFFARADPGDRTDAELVRCYYSDANFERLARVRELASRHGVAPTAIALAYVLAQPFPTFPLFGPRSLEETRSSLAALSVELAPHEVLWLDLRI
ncbi:aldo/keto reductase [Schumannella sp. 10F1B-5-1]|uniref:aldo/keto reductase n=1 Tax=Schumannella sp. 10F1B-5-1 TaxID=2590780 RepID=UPI0011311DBD|nr:aldo/keto reductase [Schumannella sp. 10F1B-5-1]TPW71696.1 oxidoreductase [Schumannella sp. 10F1B-5-1]